MNIISFINAFLYYIHTFIIFNSLSLNSIYAIHISYHSFSIAINLINFIITIWLFFFNNCINIIILIIILLLLWIFIFNWLNDIYIESFISITLTEQLSLKCGIKLLIISELSLFIACFWCLINFRFLSNAFSLFFSFPLLSCYTFSIPFSNLLILLFSSLPLQSTQIFIKIGFLWNSIESIGQSLSCAILFVLLQLKEFLYSYFTLSDCLIGSIFYFTTGLHGFHVLIGSLFFFLILFYLVSSHSLYFMEYSFSLFLSSYYWHFVDWIWFCVFLIILLFMLLISLKIINHILFIYSIVIIIVI